MLLPREREREEEEEDPGLFFFPSSHLLLRVCVCGRKRRGRSGAQWGGKSGQILDFCESPPTLLSLSLRPAPSPQNRTGTFGSRHIMFSRSANKTEQRSSPFSCSLAHAWEAICEAEALRRTLLSPGVFVRLPLERSVGGGGAENEKSGGGGRRGRRVNLFFPHRPREERGKLIYRKTDLSYLTLFLSARSCRTSQDCRTANCP